MKVKVQNTSIILLSALLLSGSALQAVLAEEHTGGDPVAGRAKVEICTACHTSDGNSIVPSYPKLAGQGEKYLLRQMRAIKSGAWPIPEMAGQLDSFSDQDLQDVAAFYAGQTMSPGATEPALADLGQQIYQGGIRARGVPACTACHAPDGAGNYAAGYPRLAGQHAEYIKERLEEYRGSAEVYDEISTIMADIATPMTPLEIEAVASYIAGLR